MTRNNLDDHLSWLLHDISLVKPTTPPLPPTSHQSQTEISRLPVHTNSQRDSVIDLSSGSFATAGLQASFTVNGSEGRGDATQEIEEVTWEDGNMGRLTSASKSKKPSLVSKPRQLPTQVPGLAIYTYSPANSTNEPGEFSTD